MSLEILALASALAVVVAGAAATRAIRFRLTEPDIDDRRPAQGRTADQYLHGMRYSVWDEEDREIIIVEGRCKNVTGYSADELLEGPMQSLSDLIHPKDRELVRSEVRKALEARDAYHINYRIRTKNGKCRWVSDRGGYVHPDGKASAGIEGVLIDITDRVSAELARVRIEEKYNLLVQNVDDLIGVHDADGRFEYVTPSAKDMLGYEPAEIRERSFYAIIHPDDRQRVRSQIRKRVREDCEVLVLKHRLRTKQGRYVPVETRCKPVQDRDGYFTRFVTVTRDISELSRLRRSVTELSSQAAQAGGMDEAFMASMNREFRTPLTSIMGFAEVLADEVAEGQRNALDMIRESGEHILSTLTSVMDFSNAASKSAKSRPTRIDVVPLARAEVERFRDPAHEKGVTLQLVPESERVFAIAHPESISRIADCLLSNAVKFTEEEGVVTVAILDEGDYVVLRVSDTGIGISEGFLPHAFEPFRQENPGLTQQTEGAGVGLALVKRLAEASAGSVEVDSEQGRGSSFTVRLPGAGRAHQGGVEATDVFKGISAQNDESTPARHGRILTLDDNDPMRLILARHLGKFFDVDPAADAEGALELARGFPYEVVLLDINLGTKKNGIDVLKEMRELPGYENTFFIAVTAYALPEEKSRFMRAGFDGLVSKPFTRDSLLKEISRVTMFNLELDAEARKK